MSAKWAAIFDTEPGRVTLRFSAPLRAIGLTPDGARKLAAKLLLLAETADRGIDGEAATIDTFALMLEAKGKDDD